MFVESEIQENVIFFSFFSSSYGMSLNWSIKRVQALEEHQQNQRERQHQRHGEDVSFQTQRFMA
jgi:hypothetical protein